jgi:hypothetical protein
MPTPRRAFTAQAVLLFAAVHECLRRLCPPCPWYRMVRKRIPTPLCSSTLRMSSASMGSASAYPVCKEPSTSSKPPRAAYLWNRLRCRRTGAWRPRRSACRTCPACCSQSASARHHLCRSRRSRRSCRRQSTSPSPRYSPPLPPTLYTRWTLYWQMIRD